MTIINTSPDRPIQLGYEGEDRVTVLRFRYGADWLENGEGIFHIRVRRHGEHTAYNAALVADDAENNCLLMTVTNTELSVKGSGEMQVVYSGEDFVKKSPIYSYNVSRAVDEAADPPAQDVYTEIIESLSGLGEDIGDIQTDVRMIEGNIGNLADLTTEAKTDLVSAINEVNEHGGVSVTVDSELSTTSENPVQNKVVTSVIREKADIQTVSALSDAVQDLDGDVQGLQTAMQGKADTVTVTALSGTVSGLQTAVQSKADAQTVTALSGTVTGLQTSKADKSYVDTQLAGKASTQTVSDLSDDVSDLQTGLAGKVEIPHTDEAKIAIQKMLGIYEAPWELIRWGGFENETEAPIDISVDDNGNQFELTDIRLAITTPTQSVVSGIGSYGSVLAYYGDNVFDPIYTGAWTQQPNAVLHSAYVMIEQKDGMLVRSQARQNTSGNPTPITYIVTDRNGSSRPWELSTQKRIYNKIRIASATGKVEIALYGKRRWQ